MPGAKVLDKLSVQPVQPPEVPGYSAGSGPGPDRFRSGSGVQGVQQGVQGVQQGVQGVQRVQRCSAGSASLGKRFSLGKRSRLGITAL